MYLDEKSYTSPPVETKPDIYSLQGFVAWLEKQPVNMTYDWHDLFDCICSRYLDAAGQTRRVRYPFSRTLGDVFPTVEIYHKICGDEPWTAGAALARARALLP